MPRRPQILGVCYSGVMASRVGVVVIALAAACAAVVAAACSVFLNSDATQCSSDGECARFGNARCDTTKKVCVASGDASATDGGCWDDGGFGGAGCYACTPTTNDQLLNACAPHQFVRFDNAARIAGFDPNNPRPALPDSGAGSDAAGDGGAPPIDSGLPACPAVTSLPNPVILIGSTGLMFQPTVDSIGIANGGASAISLVFLTVGSCDGVNAMDADGLKALPGTPVTILRPGTAPLDCALSDGPWPADIGDGALFWDSCKPGTPQPMDVQDLVGPVGPVGFIVPHASTQSSVSAEAMYKVYGFGAQSGVNPWTDDNFIWRRNPTSGNQTCVSKAVGLPIDAFRGLDSHGGANLAKNVANTPLADAEKTLGLSSTDVVDALRTAVTVVAYQHYGQGVGFYWDADPAAFDRRPVRDGHFYLWLYMHVFGHIDAHGTVTGATGNAGTLGAKRSDTLIADLVDYLALRKPLPDGRDIIAALKDPNGGAAAIPTCAMHVQRASDSGPLLPFNPPHVCDCAFEAAPPGATPPDCIKCTSDTDCAQSKRGAHCSFGYCEAR
jgi:hypothetical protein